VGGHCQAPQTRVAEFGVQRGFAVSDGVGGVLLMFRALSKKTRSVPFALICSFGAICEVILVA